MFMRKSKNLVKKEKNKYKYFSLKTGKHPKQAKRLFKQYLNNPENFHIHKKKKTPVNKIILNKKYMLNFSDFIPIWKNY